MEKKIVITPVELDVRASRLTLNKQYTVIKKLIYDYVIKDDKDKRYVVSKSFVRNGRWKVVNDDNVGELNVNDWYSIDGEEYKITNIRVTNISSKEDFLVGIAFESESGDFFTTSANDVIGNPSYKRIHKKDAKTVIRKTYKGKPIPSYMQKVNSVKCIKAWAHSALTNGKDYEVIDLSHDSFKIVDDNGKKRWYNNENTMFAFND